MRKHKHEPIVQNIMKMEAGQRNREFKRLTTEGDYSVNIERMNQKNFNLAVVWKGKLPEDKYVSCVKCHGLFNPRTINKHVKLCVADSSVSEKKTPTVKNSRMFLACALAMDAKYAKDFSVKIISRMLDDEMTNLVKNDELLMLYRYTLYEMGGEESFSEISNKLRNVSRLLIKFRETNDVSITTPGLIDPSHWDAIIAAIKSLVKHGGIEHVGIPSLLLRLGRSLEALASAKQTLGIKTKNDDIVNDARKFLELHAEE